MDRTAVDATDGCAGDDASDDACVELSPNGVLNVATGRDEVGWATAPKEELFNPPFSFKMFFKYAKFVVNRIVMYFVSLIFTIKFVLGKRFLGENRV